MGNKWPHSIHTALEVCYRFCIGGGLSTGRAPAARPLASMPEDLVCASNRDLKRGGNALERFAALVGIGDGLVAVRPRDVGWPGVLRHRGVIVKGRNEALHRRFSQKYSSGAEALWGHKFLQVSAAQENAVRSGWRWVTSTRI